jgi:NAD(P) transhydrogenase
MGYDMIVIGAGPAGEKAATQAAYFGRRVVVVDRREAPGGAVVGSAGIPTKTLRETALYLTGFRRREVYGVGMSLMPELALERLKSRTAEVTRGMTEVVRENLRRNGVELLRGEASLGRDRRVVVRRPDGASTELEGGVVLVATGSRPLRPASVPFGDPGVHDSETILQLERIPASLVVIGGGPVGCEYASIFTALGVGVTLIDIADRLLPFADAEISAGLAKTFEESGMRVLLGGGMAVVERADGRLRVRLADGEVLEPDKVLFTAGRSGNTEGLGLGELGVEVDPRGRIVVDERYRTNLEWLYAAGDVIGPPALASVAAEQGRVAACHAFGIPFKQTVDPLPPYGVYSIPEVAMVGLTEAAARAEGRDHEVGRAWLADNARSRIAGTSGLLKLVFDRRNRRLLGVHILSEEAGELVHLGQAVMHAGGTIDQFIHTTFNVPTRTEAYKYAAYDGLQRLAR